MRADRCELQAPNNTTASASVEVVKLLHYAEATDVSLIRMGTSGGLGVEPGNVILTKNGYDATLQEGHEVTTVGKKTRFPSPSGGNSRDIAS